MLGRHVGLSGDREDSGHDGLPIRGLAAADIAATHETQVIAKMGLEPAGPVALARLLPLGRLLDLGPGEVIERDVLAVAAGAPEASRGQNARHGAERGDVPLVVPLAEFALGPG